MNCPHCGAELHQRNRARLIMTGIGFIAAAMIVVFVMHLAVVILAGFVLALIGAYFLKWALVMNGLWCRKCGRVPKRVT
jgi:hypothetical protein